MSAPAPKETLAAWLTRTSMHAISAACANGMDPERLIRVSAQCVYRNPDLGKCEWFSIAAAIIEAAEVGLEPGNTTLAHGYLVPYFDKGDKEKGIPSGFKARFQASWKGKIVLARRSGYVTNIDAVEIHARDKISFFKGSNPRIEHEIMANGEDRGPVVGYYAIAFFKDGGYQFTEPWSTAKIERHRRQFSKQPDGTAWKNSPDSMAKKTMVHQLEAYLPLSAEQQVQHDREVDVPQTFEVAAQDVTPPMQDPGSHPAGEGQTVGIAPSGESDTAAPPPIPPPGSAAPAASSSGPSKTSGARGKAPSRALAAAQESEIRLPALDTQRQAVAPVEATSNPSGKDHAKPTGFGDEPQDPGPCLANDRCQLPDGHKPPCKLPHVPETGSKG